MPVCEECGESFVEPLEELVALDEVSRLYRAVADGEPKIEVLQMIYEIFGVSYGLAPPGNRDQDCRTVQRRD
jgi:hypothetical protein